ncbi:MAG: TauD/TfdA family dioxygenase [Gammaproteobacteria bacterium]|nr:TauD/TfdA family dioxygenase [Gammaproteobacteria bacterium]
MLQELRENPFSLDDRRAYQAWRGLKLDARPKAVADLIIEVADLAKPTLAERSAIISACRRANMAIFRAASGTDDKSVIRDFGRAFGLDRLDANLYADDDGITALQVSDVERKRDFIPYTNQRLNWHTDGYYNTPDRQIRGLMMFCVRDAAEGGENQLLDHEIAYILLRDAEPRFIEALMHPQAMTIPANCEQGVEIRPAESGPVFAIEPDTGNLHMRYSARTRNIVWRDDPMTLAAVEFLQNLWEEGCDYVYHYRLMPGEGIICNNVLHNRSAFRDDPASGKKRLMYRARYFDRIADTNYSDVCSAPNPPEQLAATDA